jgi:hypothetical protein
LERAHCRLLAKRRPSATKPDSRYLAPQSVWAEIARSLGERLKIPQQIAILVASHPPLTLDEWLYGIPEQKDTTLIQCEDLISLKCP